MLPPMPRATPTGPLHHAAFPGEVNPWPVARRSHLLLAGPALLWLACAPQPTPPHKAADPAQHSATQLPVAQLPEAPAPEPGTVLVQGRVRSWHGAPIAGATITTTGKTTTRSDADGRFALWLPPGGLAELQAAAPRHASASDEGPAPGHAFELWLAPESTLSGVVTRAGAPVAGARIIGERAGGLTQVTTEATTDAAGRFRLERLEPGSYSLRALTDDAAGATTTPVILGLAEARTGLSIAVTPALRITGRILGGDAPCEAGALELLDESRGPRLRFPTEAGGQIQAMGLMPGEYQVVATCPGFLPGEATRIALTDTSVLDQQWRLASGLAIRGRVRMPDGAPVNHLRVHASGEPGPAPTGPDPIQPDPTRPPPSYAEAELDADGRFVLSGLVPGTYRVTVTALPADARAVPPEPLQVTLPALPDAPEPTLTLPVTGELRGTLRDAGGHGIDRAIIMLAGSADAQHVLAADDGSFVFPSVAPRDYQLIARRNGQRLAGATPEGEAVTIAAGVLTTIAPIVTTPDLRLTGLVRDPAGMPVPGALVVLRSRSRQLLAPPVATDAVGRFTIPALAPGRYRVRAYRSGGGEASADQVEAGSDLTLTLAAP